ncbi:MAG: hypothetical protein AAGI38_22050 [Bacteroidota bacterium]
MTGKEYGDTLKQQMNSPEKNHLKAVILNGVDILQIRLQIVQMREKGFSQDETLSILKELRANFAKKGNEKSEDRVLELLDYVYGFCQETYRIW